MTKSKRTSSPGDRFCDITGVGEWLYALDRTGQVWKWSPRESIWVPVGAIRADGKLGRPVQDGPSK